MLLRRRNRQWDAQPTARCRVLLASDGRTDFTRRAVAEAAALAGDAPAAVLTIARVYGTSYGIQNPGLLPTKKEMAERLSWVSRAVKALEKRGLEVDGQVAATRKPARQIMRVALARGAEVVVIDETAATGWRRRVEGDIGAQVARSLRKHGVEVRVIPHDAHTLKV